MSITPNANAKLKQQRPTYLVAPNLTTRPFPKGPFELGTLVENLKDYYPINQGADNRVPIPIAQRYSETKEDIVTKSKTSSGGEAGLLAHILDRSIGGDVRLKGQRVDEDIYNISKMETVYFYPQNSYIKSCLQLPDVQEFMKMCRYKEPVYLITGLKLAWGATISIEQGRRYEGSVEQELKVPGGLTDVSLASNAGLSSESEFSSTFGKAANFVIGIQVQKIYHKRKFLSGERVLTTERVVKNAVLMDNEGVDSERDSDSDFITANLDAADMGGLVSWDEQVSGPDSRDEDWLLPAGNL